MAAALVSSQLHELAHAVAGLALGLRPRVFPFQVTYAVDGAVDQQVVTALAGPVFSLLFGLVVIIAGRRVGDGYARLFLLWLGFVSVMNFVGYLVIAPFATAGDTGKALRLLGAPDLAVIGLCLVGVAGQFLLARAFAAQVRRYARDIADERALAVRAWSIGTVVIMVLTLAQVLLAGATADAAVVVLTYSVAVAIFAPMQFIFHRRVGGSYEGLRFSGRRTGMVVTAVIAVLILVLAAVGGVPLSG